MTGFSFTRIYAMALRYLYLLRRSPMRIIELMYWPFMNLAVWGFTTVYLRSNSAHCSPRSALIIDCGVRRSLMPSPALPAPKAPTSSGA